MLNFEYKKNIQFLRGLSVIFVFLYHTNIPLFEKGFYGVDIFFVISGFVITQRIFQYYEKNNQISLKNFYFKRLKRILPNLFFVVGATYFFYLLFGPPDLSLWNETLTALLGISNIYYIINDVGYFDNVFDDPLAHTWSLGVEEQFYLLYPLLIYLVFSTFKNKFLKLQIIFFLIFFTSIVFYKIQLTLNPSSAFYLSPLRFWEFVFGGILFLNLERFKKNNFISFISLFMIFFLIFSKYDYDYFYLNLFIVIFSGIFIVFFSKSELIENNIFVYFGNISYSFYLWHLPVLFFFDLYLNNDNHLDVIISFICTTILSITTYHFIEQNFRYYNFKKNKRILVLCTPILLIVFLSTIYIKYFNNNLRQDLRNFVYEINFLNLKYDWNNRIPFQNLIFLDNKKIYDYCDDNSLIFKKNLDGLKEECLRQKNYKTLFFIEGDSHTAQFIPIFDQLKQIENVYYKHSLNYNISSDEVNKLSKKFSEIIYVTHIGHKDELNNFYLSYPKFENDIKFILFNSTPLPENKYQPLKCLIQQIDCSINKSEDFEKRSLGKLFDEIKIFKRENDRVFLFDSYQALCPGRKCKIYDKDKDLLFYKDESHLIVEGSKTLKFKFYEFIEKLKKNNLIIY